MRKTGTVKNFYKQWGFIRADNGTEYFVHYTHLEMDGFRSLVAGQRVSFLPDQTPKGLQAVAVRVLEIAEE